MNEINLIVELIFWETAKTYFNFPLQNNIRTSFWLQDSKKTTFAEINFQNKAILVNQKINATVTISLRDFYKDETFIGKKFNIGVFPIILAEGSILEIGDALLR